MYMTRPSEIEINAWQNIIAPDDPSAANAWSWARMYEAMKKSETFTPPTADVQKAAGIQFDAASHGSSGPLHTSYPAL